MNPSGSAEIPPEGDENVASQRPPYLSPIQPGVQLPRRTKNFTLRTPSVPPGVQLVGTMSGKIDRLKYAYHDTNDLGKFPQYAPRTYLHSVKYPESGAMLMEVK